ncbi:MAG TPA: DMT family transporter, partial [Treponemataceae bacterium]|nr:DMT family transporter [Treponemataceae bacterium]
MSTKAQTAAASLGLIFTTLIWGFAFVIVKNSLDYVPPIYMLAFRFTIAALVLPFIFLKKIKKIDLKYILNGSLLGFFLFAAYAFQTIGCQYTTAGKNAFITTIYVILVPFFHWIFTKKRPDLYAVAAAVLGITGIGLLSLQGDLSVNTGDLLTLVCGFCYAVHIVFIARFTEHQDPVILTIIQLASAAVFSWIFAPLYDGSFPLAALQNPSVVFSMLYLGLMSTMAAFLFQTVCQKYVPPSTAALLLSL